MYPIGHRPALKRQVVRHLQTLSLRPPRPSSRRSSPECPEAFDQEALRPRKVAAMTQNTSSHTAVAKTSPFLLTLLTTPGSAALRIDNSELPADTRVDETAHRVVARRLGAGVQV